MFVTHHFLCFQVRWSFFLPKATIKNKCKCGDVFGFKVSEAMKFIGCQEREQALKTLVIFKSLNEVCKQTTFRNVKRDSGCRENMANGNREI